MAVIIYHGGSGTYFKLDDDVYIADVDTDVDEDELQSAVVVDGYSVTEELARQLYEHAMQHHEAG